MTVSRVAIIKAAIVFTAAMATAVIAFVTSYKVFAFDLVSRGRALNYFTISWTEVLLLTLPNLVAALFVKRWWTRQAESQTTGTDRPSSLPWITGYIVMTLVLLLYYFLTFTALLQP